jgi:hypothetical protein
MLVADAFDGAYYITANSYTDIFSAVWKGINVNYVFWDIESTDCWDTAWDTYKPKFDALGGLPSNKGVQAMAYMQEMVTPLHDGHFTLIAGNSVFSPQDERVAKRFTGPLDDKNPVTVLSLYSNWDETTGVAGPKPYHWNFIGSFIGPKYFDSGYLADRPKDPELRIARGKISVSSGGHIAYLYFSGFSLQEAMRAEADETLQNITRILKQYWDDVDDPNCKGVIFDLRGNSGGANADIPYLLSPLLESDLLFAYNRTKKGEGRLNYGPWTPYVIKAAAPAGRISQVGKIPIVALVNDYSISCGELMPLALKSVPRAYLIGTKTYGATGPRLGSESPAALKDGSFTVQWDGGRIVVTQAGYQTRGPHFENYEGIGLDPDLVVPFSLNAFTDGGLYGTGGVDAQLEAAIKHIDPGKSFP